MQLHEKLKIHVKNLPGSFLITALVLIIIISALGVAAMSATFGSLRISKNYSDYISTKLRATSMAEYAARILQSYPNGVYPGPATCDSTSTCNIAVNTFPHNGRPAIVWTSGLPSTSGHGSAHSNTWWTEHGLNYEANFSVPGNSRVIVQLIGANPDAPYEHTYRIVGYASNAEGKARATYEMFHVWNGYPVDPGDGTCEGGCHYGECCSADNICGNDQTSCENGSASYVPPGWSCVDYFINGLGYSASACAFPIQPPM